MNEIKLKSCPFCGGAAHLYNAGDMCFVACDTIACDCPVNPWTGYVYDEAEAIEIWNRRAAND